MKEDDPRTLDLSEQCDAIERRVIVTPTYTAEGLAAKRRVVRRAEFDDEHGLIAMILKADAQRARGGLIA